VKIPDTSVTVFHTRFGGSLSIEQELEDLTDHFPTWFRPIWKFVLPFLKRWIRRAKIARTMASVDRQAAEIKQAWTVEERQQVVLAAVVKAREQNPDAHVESIAMPNHPTDAVYIERPPTPGHPAEQLLGFSSIEIKAPWAV
jgi:hypothetical protein